MASAPRCTSVALVEQTRAPDASVISLVVPMMSLPAIWRRRRDGQRRGEHVAGDDRPLVGELLLAVHDPEQVDRLGLEEGVHRLEGQHDRERRGRRAAVVRPPVAAAKRGRLSSVTSWGGRREGPADERLVDGHGPNLVVDPPETTGRVDVEAGVSR